jgi:hypothetical protein
MQLTDHDLDFCSKHYDYFSEDCSRCIDPPGPNLMMHILFQRLVISYWPLWKASNPTRRDVPSINSTSKPSGNPNHELNSENRDAKCSYP